MASHAGRLSRNGRDTTVECPKIFETTMLLLGFDVGECEKNFNVSFSRDMFSQINKKGSEVVLHFLFNKLDSSLAYEEFRDCWPVYTKKNDAEFRKRCSAWLERIAKEEPSSKLPRHTASLLMSPGGDKFYVFLMRFSAHVLRKVALELVKSEQVFLSSYVTLPLDQTLVLNEVTKKAIQAHIIRHTQSVVNRMEMASMLHKEWTIYANEVAVEYLATCKKIRETKKKLSDLIEARKKRASASSLQGQSSANERVRTLTAEVVERQRATNMAKVQELWNQLEDFFEKSSYHCEVIRTILNGEANKYSFDARTLALKIPDVIMRKYEGQYGEKMESPYQEGKLNLVSLIRLWTCSLCLLRDELVENDVPSFEVESQYLEGELEKHSHQLTTLRELRSSLAELKESIATDTKRLEANLERLRGKPQFQASSHSLMLYIPPITVPSLDFDLTPPPSPPTSSRDQITCSTTQPVLLPTLGFDLVSPSPPRATTVPTTPNIRMASSHIGGGKLKDEVSTPEAVHNISESVRKQAQQQPPPTRKSFTSETNIPHPKKPTTSKHTSIKPTLSQTVPLASSFSQHAPQHVKKLHLSQVSSKKPPVVAKNLAGTVPSSLAPVSTSSSKLMNSQQQEQTMSAGKPLSAVKMETPLLQSMPKALDILAEQIASAVATGKEGSDSSLATPFATLHSIADPIAAMGTEAFISRDKISRTPLRKDRVERLHFDTPVDQPFQEEEELSTSSCSSTPPPSLPTKVKTPINQHQREQMNAFNTPDNSLELLMDIQPPTPYYHLSDPEGSSTTSHDALVSVDDANTTSYTPPLLQLASTAITDDLIKLEDSDTQAGVISHTSIATPVTDFQPLHTSTAVDKLKFGGPGALEPAEHSSACDP